MNSTCLELECNKNWMQLCSHGWYLIMQSTDGSSCHIWLSLISYDYELRRSTETPGYNSWFTYEGKVLTES